MPIIVNPNSRRLKLMARTQYPAAAASLGRVRCLSS